MNDPLKIISTDNQPSIRDTKSSNKRKNHREEVRAKFERLWLTKPDKFNPLKDAIGRERLVRTMSLIKDFINPKGLHIVDLGSGQGVFSQRLTEENALVNSVDIAENALKILKEKYPQILEITQDYVPQTKLKDDSFDLVLGMEMIAYLQPDEYRLFFSEISRLMKPEGYTLCSTKLDLDSDDSLERFKNLAETELKFEKWSFSYHRLYIRILDFFKAPERFARANDDIIYCSEQLNRRYGFSRWWFRTNCSFPLVYLWKVIKILSVPIYRFINQSHFLMKMSEGICKFFWVETGISHAMFIGIRRPLETPPFEEPPREMKHKRQVWE